MTGGLPFDTPLTRRTGIEPLVARWWLPEKVYFDTVPMTATGKVDKKSLRARYVQ